MAKELPLVQDARVLRAVAHPVRGRILDELSAAGTLRATDVAELLQIPANQASFHLRQLAKYGLVEPAPEAARDKRDRVWRAVHPNGMHVDIDNIKDLPGGRAAMTVFRRQKAVWAHRLVDEVFSFKKEKDTFTAIVEQPLRLTKDDGEEFMDELSEVIDRWSKRSKAPADEARTYVFFAMMQPYPDLDPDA